jgi:predicted amino acid racemase
MFPRVIINLEKYRHNLRFLLDLSHKNGMSVMAVSKVFCADQNLINIMIEEQVDYIADSRIANLRSFSCPMPKVLLRLPSFGEVDEVVKYSDISLNSELSTVKLLDKAALKINQSHGVILMIDLGDLREGIINESEVYSTVEKVLELKNIDLKGIGVNLTCYGGVIPTNDTLQQLVDYKLSIERKFNIELQIISGGNSSNIDLILKGLIPPEINNIRLGESAVLGRETAYGDFLDSTYDDVFTLEADIIELKEKPSVPIGQIGMNAFGKTPVFDDTGVMLRAILAVGKQDVDYNELIPFDTIKAIGGSSDHIILDVSDSNNIYEVGDTVMFKLTYSSILSLMTSKYVSKTYE